MPANLFVDLDQLAGELLKALVFAHLSLRLTQGVGGRERFGDGLAIDFACEADLRIVSGVAGFRTVAT